MPHPGVASWDSVREHIVRGRNNIVKVDDVYYTEDDISSTFRNCSSLEQLIDELDPLEAEFLKL